MILRPGGHAEPAEAGGVASQRNPEMESSDHQAKKNDKGGHKGVKRAKTFYK
jgi:hypothetical protein